MFHNFERPTGPRFASVPSTQPDKSDPFQQTTFDRKQDIDFRQVLQKEVLGITYKEILNHFAYKSQGIYTPDYINSPTLTEQVLKINPDLDGMLCKIRASETLFDTLCSYVPFIGRSLESDQFILSNFQVNDAVKELENLGLLKADTQIYRSYPPYPHLGFVVSTSPSITTFIHITDLGHKLLKDSERD